MRFVGWIGTALVVIAYYPQIHHLLAERCAWGISVSTWVIWLVASVLLLSYCIFRQEVLLSVVQVTNIASILTTIMLVRRSNNICPYHLKSTETIARQ
ncbi:MAG: PQ-loop repeat-containing protein [Pyrinomonadaceae bacterium]